MKNMHHSRHTNNTTHSHDTKHCSKCGPKYPSQPHIIIPPTNPAFPLVPTPEVIVVSGIISLSPSQGSTAGGNPIIINGFNLIFTTSVNIGGINIPFTLLSNNQLQVIAVPRSANQTVQITVQFQNGTSESLPYTYVNTSNITSLNPLSGPITGNNIITITGIGLASTTSVYFNNIATFSFVVLSDTTLNVAVPNLTGQSNVLVHVVTLSGPSNNLPYTLIPPPII